MGANFTPNQNKYKNLTPFKCWLFNQINTWGITNFPFVESDFDELTNYGMLMKMMKALHDVVSNQNKVEQDMTNLFGAFTELQSYINDYFDNLDVQDEINNKLDDMVESGELQEIVATYLNSKAIFGFDNVASMKSAENLIDGSYAKTLGFYTINDGGNATYKIRKITNNDNVDEMFLIAMNDNTLVAELIIDNNTINIKQIGAKPQINSNKTDIKQYIDAYISKISLDGIKYNLYIPSGVWYTSGNEITTQVGFNIIGDDNFNFGSDRTKGTILTSFYENQDHILNLGNSNHTCIGWVLKNINFSSANYIYDGVVNNYKVDSLKKINSALNLKYAEYGITDNLFFNYIKGQAMSISSSWENYFKLLNFRKITNHNGAILNLKEKDTTLSANANITACTFDNIMFESVHGNLINIEGHSSLANCTFNNIFVEDNPYVVDGEVYTTFTDENVPQDLNHYSIFNLEDDANLSACSIKSILLNNYSYRFFTYNNQNYTYDTIIKINNRNGLNSIFNNIAISGMNKDCYLIYMPDNITAIAWAGYPIINNITNDTQKSFILYLNGLYAIDCKANLFGRLYTYADPSKDFYINGNWIPCYKLYSKRAYPTGLGLLYYDDESLNELKLAVKPRTTTFDRPLICSIVNTQRKMYIRAKVPNGETCLMYINNKDDSVSGITASFVGTGSYKIYEFTIPDTWNVGSRIVFEMASSSSYSKNIMMDVFKSF